MKTQLDADRLTVLGPVRRFSLLDTRAIAEAVRLYETGWSLARPRTDRQFRAHC